MLFSKNGNDDMWISKAYAQVAPVVAPVASAAVEAPSAMEQILSQMGFVALLVTMFYVLLIRPQQKRFKEHSALLKALKKGDKVVTGGGLVGTIDTIKDDSEEVVVDLGAGVKVTALRSTLQGRSEVVTAPKVKTEEKKK